MQVQFVHLNKNFDNGNKRGFDLISDAQPFGRLLYREPDQEHTSRCHVCSVLALLGQIVGLVYSQASLKTHVRFSLTKNWANLNAYYEWLTINVAPTQMSVGMA